MAAKVRMVGRRWQLKGKNYRILSLVLKLKKYLHTKSESISDSELIQQLSVLDNVQFPPQLKNKLISLLPVNEVAEPAHHYDSEKRIQELDYF